MIWIFYVWQICTKNKIKTGRGQKHFHVSLFIFIFFELTYICIVFDRFYFVIFFIFNIVEVKKMF